MKSPIYFEVSVFPSASLFRGQQGDYSKSVGHFGDYCCDMGSEGQDPVESNPKEVQG